MPELTPQQKSHDEQDGRRDTKNHDLLDLVEARFIVPPIIKLAGARRGMVGNGGGLFQHHAIFEIGGNAGGAERVIALGRDFGAADRRRINASVEQRSRTTA